MTKVFLTNQTDGKYAIRTSSGTIYISKQDLKDLRDLITEELVEDIVKERMDNLCCEQCGGSKCWDNFCKCHTGEKNLTPVSKFMESISQPLTEGEKKNRDGMRDRATVAKENIAKKEKNDLRNRYQPQQESKEECKYCMGDHQSATCNAMKEPSKKPSQRISEISKEVESRLNEADSNEEVIMKRLIANTSATIDYLDELHERKVI